MLACFKLFRSLSWMIPRQLRRTFTRENVFYRKSSTLRSPFLLLSLSFICLLLLSALLLIDLKEKLLFHGIWKTAIFSQRNAMSIKNAKPTPKLSTEAYLNLSKSYYEYFRRTRCNTIYSDNTSSSSISFLSKTNKIHEGTHHVQNVPIGDSDVAQSESPISITPSAFFEIFWSKAEERFTVCWFHNTCINRKGALYLPAKIKEIHHLFRGCLSNEVVYFENTSLPRNEASILPKQLYGLTEARKHIPLFVTDVIPSIYANQLIRSQPGLNSELSYKCFSGNGSICTTNRYPIDQLSCSNSLLVEDRVLKLDRNHWVPQFSNMLLDNAELVSLTSMFQYENVTERCFRSIISYSPFQLGGTPQKSSLWKQAQESFFQSNGLHKSLKTCTSESHQNLHIRKDTTCQVHIVIVNRKPGDDNDPLSSGRDLLDLSKIERKLIYDFKRTHKPRIDLKISTVYFEEMTFPEQVYTMQTADVIVGIHGAGLTNLVFAKADTPVLEIFPFFYFPIRFKMFSYGFNLDYSYIFAEPDPNSYFRCINYRTRNGQKEDIFVIALDTWREALRRKTNATHERPLDSSEERRNIAIRSCARSQRLRINIPKFSEQVLGMSKKFCRKLR